MEESEIQDLWDEAAAWSSDRDRLRILIACLSRSKDYNKFEFYMDLLMNTAELSIEEKLFLYGQVSNIIFTLPDISKKLLPQRLKLWKYLSESFQSNFDNLRRIENRNASIVLVTVQQFLNTLNHGPTKTTLDRAYALANMGKNVFIVNTAEMCGGYMEGTMYHMGAGYDESLSQCEKVGYLDKEFPYIQFEQNMPNVQGTELFLQYISELKPAFIVNIGGDSLTLDCAARMIPVLNINTVPSSIAATLATKQVIGRKKNHEDEMLMSCLGLSCESVLEGRFTSSLKSQKLKFARRDLHLPENEFLLAVVGGRLTTEADYEFIKSLESTLAKGAHFVIVGEMYTYDELCKRIPLFGQHSTNLGMQSDVLAVLECCDLYVNPRRIGGGTSVIEAMSKGLPAVTIDYGDVAVGAGKDFCVADYKEMEKKVLRYMTDDDYYAVMSGKAKERADYMLDSEQAFTEIVEEFLRAL